MRIVLLLWALNYQTETMTARWVGILTDEQTCIEAGRGLASRSPLRPGEKYSCHTEADAQRALRECSGGCSLK